MFSRYNYSDMIKKLIYISVCMTLIVACDLEDEYKPQRPQVEDNRNDNRNIGGYVVASRVETPHVNGYVGHNKASDGVVPTTDSNGYSPRSDGKVGLPVPEYYYMALLSVKNGVYHGIAFLVPHSEDLPKSPKAAELQKYVTTIDDLEYMTGIDFFCECCIVLGTVAVRGVLEDALPGSG